MGMSGLPIVFIRAQMGFDLGISWAYYETSYDGGDWLPLDKCEILDDASSKKYALLAKERYNLDVVPEMRVVIPILEYSLG